MKRSLFSGFLLSLIAVSCQKSSTVSVEGRYKARLEVKGICSNYTLSIVEGNIDPDAVEAQWTDPKTGKTYNKAFAMSNSCGFPSNIKEGDEFYIEVTKPHPTPWCGTCAAYYPTPKKSLFFNVVE